MILTIICTSPNAWVVAQDEGYITEYRGIALNPASSRSAEIVFGPTNYHDCMMFIANRNHGTGRKNA
jgi:hypothetical protein